jgi:FkbM family methyltransferase
MNPLQKAGLKSLRQFNWLWKLRRRRQALRQFQSISFQPGDIAIDCGANIGDVTMDLVSRGALVHAFEPNPLAMDVLRERIAGGDNVVCHEKAVAETDDGARLYLHHRLNEDPLGHSAGSSLIGTKHNLDIDRFIEVETVDLALFIAQLPERVKLLKIDVEGLEARLVNHLIDRNVIDRIDHVFCETHKFKVPDLAAQCRRLRRRLRRNNIQHVNLDWI